MMNKKNAILKSLAYLSLHLLSVQVFGQFEESDIVKVEHAQIGIVEEKGVSYRHTDNLDAQWFPQAAFGMFIHWSISSIRELDLSWPMMAGSQIGWRSPKMDSAEVKKIMESGDYFAGHGCKKTNSCITPNEYWALAKEFNPKHYDPEKWVKAAKDAGMTYAVLTTRHHDGFALWPSAYGHFNTKNYMGGRDLVKDFVAACKKYGLKVGLYYSGPDWYQNGEFQNFMYHGVEENYPDIPVLDANLQPRKTLKSDKEKQEHYREMAAYVKGQVQELLTNYGKIDLLWFDGAPDIPKGNPAWKECITMDQIHQLQPGIVVSPRFFGYGDFKTFENDRALPIIKQDGWAELCTPSHALAWGYVNSPLKSTTLLLSNLVRCRSNNTNMLLNFGPTKDGDFTEDMYGCLHDFAAWMKTNGAAINGAKALDSTETASVPATARKNHRYLFLIPKPGESAVAQRIVLKTKLSVKKVSMLGRKDTPAYKLEKETLTVFMPAAERSTLADVIDVELK
jgi:alpha-L-fucosidase